ncbi:MAG: DUF1272 domain-containing protein [Pseudomonas marincola]
MLLLKTACETCNVPLPNDGPDAYICTIECTFCQNCKEETHKGFCPNCTGNLVLRPTRPTALIQKHPQRDE